MGIAGAEHDIAMITSYPGYYLSLFERDTTMLDMIDRAAGIGAVCASGLCDESIGRMNRALGKYAGRHAGAAERFGRCVELTAASLAAERSVVTDMTEPPTIERRFVGIDRTAFELTGMPAAVLCCSDIGDAEPAGMVLSYLLRRNGRVYRQLDARLGEGCAASTARTSSRGGSSSPTATATRSRCRRPSMSRTTVAYAPPPGALLLLARITGDGRIDSRCSVPLPQGTVESVRYDEGTIAVGICAPDGVVRCYRLCIEL